MSKFISEAIVESFVSKSKTLKINVVRFSKQGTNRKFFAVENESGQRYSSTMFARKYDAAKYARLIIRESEKLANDIVSRATA